MRSCRASRATSLGAPASTLLLLAAIAITACPHDFTRPSRDRAMHDADARAGDRSQPRPDLPCRTNAECADPFPCTEDTCTSTGCTHVPIGPQCFVGGTCVDTGTVNPANTCERCDPVATRLSFTPFPGPGCVGTIAGGRCEPPDYVDGSAELARFHYPLGLTVDATGVIYVADHSNVRIRMVSGGMVSTLAGSGVAELKDGPGATAGFYSPTSVALSPLDGLIVTDTSNHAIRRVDLSTRVVSTLLGDGTGGFGDGPASTAKLRLPRGVASGPAGIYFASDGRIRLIASDAARTVSTVAGSSTAGFKDGPAASAQFSVEIEGLAVLDDENIFVADTDNHRIRHIRRDGAALSVVTLAGENWGYKDGPGDQARFCSPWGIALGGVTPAGLVLYVADQCNSRVRKVVVGPPVMVSTVAGTGAYGCQDGMPLSAQIPAPPGVAVDGSGRIYVTDAYHTIRVINPPL